MSWGDLVRSCAPSWSIPGVPWAFSGRVLYSFLQIDRAFRWQTGIFYYGSQYDLPSAGLRALLRQSWGHLGVIFGHLEAYKLQ